MTSIKERTEIARESKRDIPTILTEIETLATLSNDVALSCFYVVFDKRDNKRFIGISVRFAELIASSWGNIHTGAKITSNNGMNLTVQGFVHDFEKNAVFTVEVQRYIGKLSPERVVQVTNAASSIAFRNAIFKAIPAAITYSITKNIKQYIVENIDGGSVIDEIIIYFKNKKVEKSDLENLIGSLISEISPEQLFLLIGLKNAIEEGDTTIAEIFGTTQVHKPQRSSKFNFSTNELTEEETAQVQKVNEIIGKAVEPLIESKKVVTETVIGDIESPKEQLKSGISSLAESKEIPSIFEEEEPKPEKKKKRSRGRPKKNN